MQSELARLSSFVRWPADAPLAPSLLARSGFFYSGPGDRCVCFRCRLSVDGWNPTDRPDDVHLRLAAGKCSFIAEKCNDNNNNKKTITGRVAPTASGTGSRSEGSSSDSGGRDDTDFAHSSNTRTAGSDPSCRSFAHLVESPPARAADNVDRRRPDFDQLKSEQNRLSTFDDFPPSFRRNVDPRQLAASGLYYTGQTDRVQCVYCRGYLRNWERGDVADDEHRRHFPNCPFMRGREVGNDYDNGGTNTRDAQPRVILTETDSVARPAAKHPDYVDLERRVQSFDASPGHVHRWQTARQLAEAGFFHVGPDDNVRCFQCDGGLKNWQPNDDAWKEHVRWFPRCPFIQSKKNDDTTGSVVSCRPRRVEYRVEPREIKARMDSTMVQTVVNMGYSRQSIRYLIEERLTSHGDDFASAQELLEAVLDLEETSNGNTDAECTRTGVESTAPGTRTDNNNGGLCLVCRRSEVNTVFLPCGHLITCQSCCQSLKQCPVCGTRISDTVKVYVS
jgi:hypothetical protein